MTFKTLNDYFYSIWLLTYEFEYLKLTFLKGGIFQLWKKTEFLQVDRSVPWGSTDRYVESEVTVCMVACKTLSSQEWFREAEEAQRKGKTLPFCVDRGENSCDSSISSKEVKPGLILRLDWRDAEMESCCFQEWTYVGDQGHPGMLIST